MKTPGWLRKEVAFNPKIVVDYTGPPEKQKKQQKPI
jgi:hypothetical protein